MASHLPIGPLTTRYRYANPVLTSPLADDITTAPSGPVFFLWISFLFLFVVIFCLFVCFVFVSVYLLVCLCLGVYLF